MPYYLHRATPLDDWRVCVDPLAAPLCAMDGEVIELPGCHWYSQAQAEADKRNGKGDGGQGVLGI